MSCAFLAASLLPAQTAPSAIPPSASPDQPASSQTTPAPHRQIHSVPTKQPATPATPAWPINDRPVPATVAWNRDQLRIDAANSSLQQILTDVAAATGATVEGDTSDERVFGKFGPAPARDVLAQLLQGSGYNVVMVGDQGQGVPRELILSARNSNKAPQGSTTRPSSEDNEDDTADYPQPEPQPQPIAQPPRPLRPGFPPDGAPGRIPQQPTEQQQPQTQQGQQPNTPQNE